ncbi:hypothetical protein RI056_05710 [Komagataeibacter nataicola]|uniref:glycine-rich domain-containing protein n=1 Tax=Komagataeibacter nataicola TaxID=265960 RepID=UPI0028B21F26|nr:hypothetical protein [Komagataeibacter nataicola]WNM09451.1 hypothetical protein RI056_05710 [Komagataeibacter nataicola]
MDLIIGTGTVTEANRDTMPATGTPGWATDGNPAATIPATDFPAAHYNMVMAEIIQPILDAGLMLDPANWGQLSAAIKALAKQAASGAVLGSPGVLATGDVAGSVLYYSAALKGPAFTYGTTTVGLLTATALDGYITSGALTTALNGYLPLDGGKVTGEVDFAVAPTVPDAAAAQNPVTLGQLQAMNFIANALIGVTSITSSLTFTRNAATKWLHIRACGGGGGGGGAPYTDGNDQASGGGGLSGQYIEFWITADDFGDSVDIVIGAGGTAPSSAAGGNGGTTTIGSLVTLLGGGGGFGGSWGSVGEILPQYSTDAPPAPAKGIVVLSRPTTAGRSPMITFSKSNGKSGDGGDTPLGTGGPGTEFEERWYRRHWLRFWGRRCKRGIQSVRRTGGRPGNARRGDY